MPRHNAAEQKKVFESVVRAQDERQGRGAPVRDAFFRCKSEDGTERYPLAQLMSSRAGRAGGGRGGGTRLALYLSLIWVAGGGDHSSARPASFWARLLGLSDPDAAGSRVVRSTWSELGKRRLVEVTPGDYTGDIPTVRLLREDGSGRPYTIPTGTGGDTYRRVPQNAWRHLLPEQDLTGAGLAMYLVAVRTSQRAGTTVGLTFPASRFKSDYGLGESTRKSGLRNLVDLGVLEADPRRTDDFGGPVGRRRLRNVYDLLDVYAPPPSAPTAE